jgi:hypothetical protein
MRTRSLEPGEEAAIERLLAWAEVAGDEIALAPAMRKASVLEKAAMDEARRLGGLADRATHAGRVEVGLALVRASLARRALEPGGQRLGIGEER